VDGLYVGLRISAFNRYNGVKSFKVAILALAAFTAGCDRTEDPDRPSTVPAVTVRIQSAQESFERARATLDEFPRLDLILRATRQFIILRQVELSEELLTWKTQEDLEAARSRAEEVLPKIAQFTPMLRRIEDALFDLRGALYRALQSEDLHSESRAELGQCRSLIGTLIDDLLLAIQVLNSPDSVYPQDSDYYDPDFVGVLQVVQTALESAMKRAQQD
jgi:hypothetical protein